VATSFKSFMRALSPPPSIEGSVLKTNESESKSINKLTFSNFLPTSLLCQGGIRFHGYYWIRLLCKQYSVSHSSSLLYTIPRVHFFFPYIFTYLLLFAPSWQ
jgi:hypothetical protein